MIVLSGKKISESSRNLLKSSIEKGRDLKEKASQKAMPLNSVMDDGSLLSHKIFETLGTFDPTIVIGEFSVAMGGYAFEKSKEKKRIQELKNNRIESSNNISENTDDFFDKNLSSGVLAASATATAVASSIGHESEDMIDKLNVNEDFVETSIAIKDSGDIHTRSQLNPDAMSSSCHDSIQATLNSIDALYKDNVSEGTYNATSKIIESAKEITDSCTSYLSDIWNNDIMSFASNIIDNAQAMDTNTIAVTASVALGTAAFLKVKESLNTPDLSQNLTQESNQGFLPQVPRMSFR